MLRIIDNKRIDLTAAEFKLYQEICKSYDRPNFKGEDLFKGLFETDKKGRIIFLIPPSGSQFSMEVYMFLVNVMVHQHLGDSCKTSGEATSECRKVILEAKQVIREAKQIIQKLKSGRK
jgi:hypothetical protein